MSRRGEWLGILLCFGLGLLRTDVARGQIISLQDVSPDRSTLDAIDADSASGGRVNGTAVDPNNKAVMYAATEWGGLYKSTDGGNNWTRLNGHRPVVTWDVKVDPSNSNRVYATSFYDGRASASSQSGINVSIDGGTTWTHPATAVPPVGFCANASDRTERSAFGIAIDPTNSARVYIGTSCGLAISTDSGVTWSFSTPDGAGTAVRIWDLVAAGDGFGADMCGDAGHYYRNTGGGWTAGSGLPSGLCSMAVSPYDPSNTNLFATVGNNIYETTDGFSWTATRTNPNPQGRIPFVATNKRSSAPAGNVFDLWFGDVSLYRVACDRVAAGPKCGTGNTPAWSPQVLVCSVATGTTCSIDANCPAGQSCKTAGYTRANGGHDDMGGILFDPSAANDACPLLMSSDGGVYVNTATTSPACQTPAWEQPVITPHALWPWSLSGADLSGVDNDHLYFGNQDNGQFGTFNAGPPTPTWQADACCDAFDNIASEFGSGSILYSVCCGAPRATNFYKKAADFSGGGVINYPTGGLTPGFAMPDVIARWGAQRYAMLTVDCTAGSNGCVGGDGGLYITQNIDAVPIVWSELGDATDPQGSSGVCSDFPPRTCDGTPGGCGGSASCAVRSPCAVYTSSDAAVFYVQTGRCNGVGLTDELFKFTGTGAGSWTKLTLPASSSFGVVAVDPGNPNRLLASGITLADAKIYRSDDGGANWIPMANLDTLMRGSGDFPIKNQRGPLGPADQAGYYQPSLLAFDPLDSNTLVAGGIDSGIFYSNDNGASWTEATDPRTSHVSGVPHIPRPRHARFSEADHDKSVYVTSQGRGVWRLGICTADAFEDDDAVANFISSGATQDRSLCASRDQDYAYFILTESSAVTIETAGSIGDPTLTLYDGGFNQIDFDDNSGIGEFSRIVRTCGAGSVLPAGTYFIRVGGNGSFRTIATYTLSHTAVPCCGNGAVDPGEACDDGNRVGGDCCAAACTTEPTGSACNDGNGCTVNDTCGPFVTQHFDGVVAPALPAGWIASGSGTPWRTTTATSDSPPNSAGTDDPPTITDKLLDWTGIAIGSSATLTFRNSYSLETNFDGGVLEIKIGAGAFQDILAAGGSFVSGGYTGTISVCCANPLSGRQAWSGNSGGFITTTVNLPAAAVGQTITLRWRVGTDSSEPGIGQNIDAIHLTGTGQVGCRSGPTITAPGSVGTIVAANKSHYDFPAVPGATQYDVLRGLASALPVGPGGGDEVCGTAFSNAFDDGQRPLSGTSYWYLARAENTCGTGTYGQQSNGAVRNTTTCP